MTHDLALAICLTDLKANPVGADMSRAVRRLSDNEGPNTAWLRANADVARRAHADMVAEREAFNAR